MCLLLLSSGLCLLRLDQLFLRKTKKKRKKKQFNKSAVAAMFMKKREIDKAAFNFQFHFNAAVSNISLYKKLNL